MFSNKTKTIAVFIGFSITTLFLSSCGYGQVAQKEDTRIGNSITITTEVEMVIATLYNNEPVLHMGASEYGAIVVEQFLMQFPTIFATTLYRPGELTEVGEERFFAMPRTYGLEQKDGGFSRWDSELGERIVSHERLFELGLRGIERLEGRHGYWVRVESILTDQIPDIFLRNTGSELWELRGFYTSDDIRITGEPWLWHDMLYATNFSLWDFDGSGIPYILIEYWGDYHGSGDGGAPASFFRYINGGFERVQTSFFGWANGLSYEWFPFQGYYHDQNGDLVGYFFGISDASPFYAHISFDENIADIKEIASGLWSRESGLNFHWTNYITGEEFDGPAHSYWSYTYGIIPPTPRYIPGTTNMLTPIAPLVELRDYITDNIIQYLFDD